MKIDLTCPVELWRYELPTEVGDPCRLTLYNLSDKDVASLQITLSAYDIEGEAVSRQVERVQGIGGEPVSTFEVDILMEGGEEAAGMELVIEKVWFGDGTVWRRGNAHLWEYVPNTLPNNRRLEMLRFVAGGDAVGYPQDQGPLWLCVCGRANAASEAACRRCRREKLAVFERFNQQTIEEMVKSREEELDTIARRARMQASQQQLAREEKLKRKKRARRRALISVLVVVFLLGAAYGVYFHGIPYYNYVRAAQQMNRGLYEEAIAAFAQMPGYLNADELAMSSGYLKASEDLKLGTDASMLLAQETFASLGDFADSPLRVKESQYLRAQKMLQDGRYDEAAELFGQIPDYSNARVRRQEARFKRAEEMMKKAEYEDARAILLELDSYPGAQKLALQCLYEPGVAALASKDFETAITLLAQAKGYPGAELKLQEAQYGQGEALRAAGEYVLAGEHYLAAGSYLDAQTKAWACIYEPAKERMAAGEYGQAAEMFLKIQGYSDSRELAYECLYQVAGQAMTAKEYQRARDLYLSIPGYLNADDMAQEALYQPALQLAKDGNLAQALEEFAKIPGYKDVADQVQAVRYKQASAHMAAGEYDQAITMYQALGEYSDSPGRIQDALYRLAGQALAAGHYASAIEQYNQLNGYSDSDEKIKEARYLLAVGHQEAGEYQEALALFASLGKYKDAQEHVSDCSYELANLQLKDGDLTAAAQAFEALGKYKDAQTLFQQTNYQLAMQARDAGDLFAAGAMFAQIKGYQDAAAQSEAAYDGYYAQVKLDAKAAMDRKDYAAAVEALSTVELSGLPSKYKDLKDIYNLANYTLANNLYAQGKPYEALPYYRNIPDYKDVTSAKLKRNCYLVLGSWVSKSGMVMEFRDDGTCVIDVEALYFNVPNAYSMHTGVSTERMTLTHKVTYVKGDNLTLRDVRNGKNTVIQMTRAE